MDHTPGRDRRLAQVRVLQEFVEAITGEPLRLDDNRAAHTKVPPLGDFCFSHGNAFDSNPAEFEPMIQRLLFQLSEFHAQDPAAPDAPPLVSAQQGHGGVWTFSRGIMKSVSSEWDNQSELLERPPEEYENDNRSAAQWVINLFLTTAAGVAAYKTRTGFGALLTLSLGTWTAYRFSEWRRVKNIDKISLPLRREVESIQAFNTTVEEELSRGRGIRSGDFVYMGLPQQIGPFSSYASMVYFVTSDLVPHMVVLLSTANERPQVREDALARATFRPPALQSFPEAPSHFPQPPQLKPELTARERALLGLAYSIASLPIIGVLYFILNLVFGVP